MTGSRSTIPSVPRRATLTSTVADHLGLAAQAHAAIGAGTDGEPPEPAPDNEVVRPSPTGAGHPAATTTTRKATK